VSRLPVSVIRHQWPLGTNGRAPEKGSAVALERTRGIRQVVSEIDEKHKFKMKSLSDPAGSCQTFDGRRATLRGFFRLDKRGVHKFPFFFFFFFFLECRVQSIKKHLPASARLVAF
jgi:hypothetical protein